MVNIGEMLGEKAKGIVLNSVQEGDVYRFRLTPEEGVVPKNKGDIERNKYFIVVGKDNQGNAFGFVLINSSINQHLPKCRRDLHKVLRASKYDFLENQDRYVDCSDFKKISKDRFVEVFSADKLKGKLDEEDLAQIREAICSYENVSVKMLKRFGLIKFRVLILLPKKNTNRKVRSKDT